MAAYRAGIQLYLRMLALELARCAGRMSPSGAVPLALDLGSLFPPSTAAHASGPSLPLAGKISEFDIRASWSPNADPADAALLRGAIEAVLAGIDVTDSPGATLSGAYEALLRYAPARATRFVLEPSSEHAKRYGSYYTTPALARAVVEGALSPIRDRLSRSGATLRLLDPAMGTGVFLLEGVQALVHAGAGTPAEVAETCVFGYDIDPLAVEVAVLALWIETGAHRDILTRNIRTMDTLQHDAPSRGRRFDLVVGNPPWGARFTTVERRSLARRWPRSHSGSFDSFKLFLDVASQWSDGAIGVIVPRAVLGQSSHAGVRELLLQRFAPYEVCLLGPDQFPHAVAPACSLIFGPRPGPSSIACRVAPGRGVQAGDRPGIPARLWTRDRFPVRGGAVLDLLQHLCAHHPRICNLAHLYRVRDAGINYNRASVARRVLYEGDLADDPRDLPRYRGRNFARYGPIRQGGWLRHEASLRLEPGEQLYVSPEIYDAPEKVVLRQTADRITATLDQTRMVMGRSVIAVVATAHSPLLPLLACLNSTLFTRLYRALAGEEGRVLPQVKVTMLSLLPLPSACLAGANDALWMGLGELARAQWARAGDDALLDRQIDLAVEALFGLSAAEAHLL